jgi:hypothetical protein
MYIAILLSGKAGSGDGGDVGVKERKDRVGSGEWGK